MAGIIKIKILLKEMRPVLDKTDYVFTTKECFQIDDDIIALNPIATFLESEGMTVVVTRMNADKHKLSYDAIFNKITLEVHSSLEAVGLTRHTKGIKQDKSDACTSNRNAFVFCTF